MGSNVCAELQPFSLSFTAHTFQCWCGIMPTRKMKLIKVYHSISSFVEEADSAGVELMVNGIRTQCQVWGVGERHLGGGLWSCDSQAWRGPVLTLALLNGKKIQSHLTNVGSLASRGCSVLLFWASRVRVRRSGQTMSRARLLSLIIIWSGLTVGTLCTLPIIRLAPILLGAIMSLALSDYGLDGYKNVCKVSIFFEEGKN